MACRELWPREFYILGKRRQGQTVFEEEHSGAELAVFIW